MNSRIRFLVILYLHGSIDLSSFLRDIWPVLLNSPESDAAISMGLSETIAEHAAGGVSENEFRGSLRRLIAKQIVPQVFLMPDMQMTHVYG